MKINKFFNLKSRVELLTTQRWWDSKFQGLPVLSLFLCLTKHSTRIFCCLNFSFYEYTWHEIWICSAAFTAELFCSFSASICFYIALDTEQIPYINHLMEKLMHMTADMATNSSVGIDDSILVGDDKSHFDRWNVKKLLFLLWWMLLLLLFPLPYIAAGCSPFIMFT